MRHHQPGEAECVRSLHCMSGGGCRLFSCQGRGHRSVCPSHTPSLRTQKEGISAMRLFSMSTRSIKHPFFNSSLFLYYQICCTHWRPLCCTVLGSGDLALQKPERSPSSGSGWGACHWVKVYRAGCLHAARVDL